MELNEGKPTGSCPECGADIPLTTRGKLFKHDDLGGEICSGSGGEPAEAPPESVTEVGPEPDDEWPDDEPDAPPAPPTPGHPVEDLGYGKGAYSWQMTVRQPALYLDDKAWHHENGKAAALAAEAAGHTATGEAQCTAVAATEDGSGLVLTYTLPIDTRGDQRG